MAFVAKPSGAYSLTSDDGINNQVEYYNYFINYTTRNCIIGMLCNIFAESGLNPWRWQGDNVAADYSNGYGLYQYTPASGYINLQGIPDHAPNMSTTEISGGNVSDAIAQMYVFRTNTLLKWINTCWRSYWDPTTYSDLYEYHQQILDMYGDGTSLSMAQFFTIDNPSDACFAFMACFEGPAVPNFQIRQSYIQTIDDNLPDQPTPHIDFSDPKNICLYLSKKNVDSSFFYKRNRRY